MQEFSVASDGFGFSSSHLFSLYSLASFILKDSLTSDFFNSFSLLDHRTSMIKTSDRRFLNNHLKQFIIYYTRSKHRLHHKIHHKSASTFDHSILFPDFSRRKLTSSFRGGTVLFDSFYDYLSTQHFSDFYLAFYILDFVLSESVFHLPCFALSVHLDSFVLSRTSDLDHVDFRYTNSVDGFLTSSVTPLSYSTYLHKARYVDTRYATRTSIPHLSLSKILTFHNQTSLGLTGLYDSKFFTLDVDYSLTTSFEPSKFKF